MKKEQIIRACLIVLILVGITSGFLIGKGHEMSQSIRLDTLEERVFEQYGEGDAGVEQMLFLKTGVHQDFMGNPYPVDTIIRPVDNACYNFTPMRGVEYMVIYQVTISDTMTYIYDQYGKFVAKMPFEGNSAWDKIMLADNL